MDGRAEGGRKPPGSRDLARERREAAVLVLSEYLRSHSCICTWPQFGFWAGKEQGPGWQDNLQNDLVEAALDLPFMRREPPSVPEYWLESEVVCGNCCSRWKHFRVEWRMLAFQDRLVPYGSSGPGPSSGYGHLTGDSICATLGHEPEAGRPILSTGEWMNFMLGRPFRTEPYVPDA